MDSVPIVSGAKGGERLSRRCELPQMSGFVATDNLASSSGVSGIFFSFVAASDLGYASIDKEFDAGNVASFSRRQERDSFGDIIGISHSAQRNGVRHLLF